MTESRHSRHGDRPGRAQLALAIVVVACTANAACPPEDGDGTVIGKGGLLLAYRLSLESDPAPKAHRIPMAKHFALEVQLCDKDGASSAQLRKADASMPAHRHGINYRPTITPLGKGRFRVDGMMFHMAGQWELAFEVQAGKELTRLTHDVQAD